MIKYMELDGIKYPINTDFKVAILCDKIANNPDIDDLDRAIDVVTLLLGPEAPFTQEALEKCRTFLQGDETGGKRIVDYEQHWDYFVGAFRQAYGLNLNEVDMHYHEFVSLLKSLKNTALNDVVELLTYDLSEVKDPKQRHKIINAQNKFKIKRKTVVKDSEFLNQLSPKVRGNK